MLSRHTDFLNLKKGTKPVFKSKPDRRLKEMGRMFLTSVEDNQTSKLLIQRRNEKHYKNKEIAAIETESHMQDYDPNYAFFSKKNPISMSTTYASKTDRRGYIVFEPHKLLSSSLQDHKLVFNHIIRNDTKSIYNHPQFSEQARKEIETEIDRIRRHYGDDNFKLEMLGYSKGGYAATYWGSLMNIDTHTINPHIMPYNTFPKTTASITHHSIVDDPYSFKYGLFSGMESESFKSAKHFVYSPKDGNNGHTLFPYFGEQNVEKGKALYDGLPVVKGESRVVQRGLDLVGASLAYTDAAFDIVEHKYSQAAKSVGITSAAIALGYTAGEALQIGASGLTAYQSYKEFKNHEPVRGGVHAFESAGMAASTLGGPVAMMASSEASAALDKFDQANEYRKQHNRALAALTATEGTLYGLGSVGSIFFGPAANIIGGGLALGIHVATRAVQYHQLVQQQYKEKEMTRNHIEQREARFGDGVHPRPTGGPMNVHARDQVYDNRDDTRPEHEHFISQSNRSIPSIQP